MPITRIVGSAVKIKCVCGSKLDIKEIHLQQDTKIMDFCPKSIHFFAPIPNAEACHV